MLSPIFNEFFSRESGQTGDSTISAPLLESTENFTFPSLSTLTNDSDCILTFVPLFPIWNSPRLLPRLSTIVIEGAVGGVVIWSHLRVQHQPGCAAPRKNKPREAGYTAFRSARVKETTSSSNPLACWTCKPPCRQFATPTG